MRLLIVDNESAHTSKILSLLMAERTTIISWNEFRSDIVVDFDGVILSGSSYHSVLNRSDVYAEQHKLILESKRPILGICAGFQLIAKVYGAQLQRQREKIRGVKQLCVLRKDPLLSHLIDGNVYEAHHWIVKEIPDVFITLATSDTGIEVIKHKDKLLYGVQFHPEVTKPENDGAIIMRNFLDILRGYYANQNN